MHRLILLLFISIFLLDYLSITLKILPRSVTWAPEIISMFVMAVVFMRLGMVGARDLPTKYRVFLILFLLNISMGIIINLVSAPVLIAGFRTYLKFLPFFLVPFVFRFSEKQIKTQLIFLLCCILLQTPFAIYQRLFLHAGGLTGDIVIGTINSSSVLTILMACSISIIISFSLANRIKPFFALMLVAVLFIPMTLNETKSTLVLLPVAIFAPLFLKASKLRLSNMLPVMMLGVSAMVAFVVTYDYFMRPRWGYGLMDFLAMDGRASGYLYKEAGTGSGPQLVGKVDSYILAIQVLSNDITSLLVGLGIGNVSGSFLEGFEGEYARKYAHLGVGITALAQVLWETGLFGAMSYYIFFFMVFRDAQKLKWMGGLWGAYAAGWSVIMVLMTIVVPYLNVFQHNVVAYLMWYFSGHIAARKCRWEKQGYATDT